MDLAYDEKHQVWIRPNSNDKYIITEVSGYKHLAPEHGGHLLDIGGNIGAVARWWLRNGGTKVTTVEPEPSNLAVLRHNLAEFGDRARIIHAAAVADDAPKAMSLYLSKNTNARHSLKPTRGRESILVRTVKFSELCQDADVVKMDIERGEYFMLREIVNMPPRIKRFTIEWHLDGGELRQRAIATDAELQQRGWQGIKGGFGTEKSWVAVRTYVR